MAHFRLPPGSQLTSRKAFGNLATHSLELIPFALGHPGTRICLIRGIRYHVNFATDLHGLIPQFTRAINARSIMINVVPPHMKDNEVPYCIWYPQVADESTYRELVRVYPGLRYHVGRACAVAGYIDFYRELDILPEVSIAEEAQDNDFTEGARKIFGTILMSTRKYTVMSDYTRTVALGNPRPATCLNADTAVRSHLTEQKQEEKLQ